MHFPFLELGLLNDILDGLVIQPLIRIIHDYAKPLVIIESVDVRDCLWGGRRKAYPGGFTFHYQFVPFGGAAFVMTGGLPCGLIIEKSAHFPPGRIDYDPSTLEPQLKVLGLESGAGDIVEIHLDKVVTIIQGHTFTFPATWYPEYFYDD